VLSKLKKESHHYDIANQIILTIRLIKKLKVIAKLEKMKIKKFIAILC